jgi:hypothetical protein
LTRVTHRPLTASEAVDWLVSRTYQVTGSGQGLTPDDKSPTVTSPVQFSERMTRLEAIQYCQALVDRSIFVPITGSDTFQDGPFVYSLNYDLIAVRNLPNIVIDSLT